MTAVNAAPGSPQPNSSGKIRRCALLEIGRNSVSPWMTPRTTALRRSTRAGAYGRVPAGRSARTPLANLATMQQRSLGATGLKVSRLGLGTMTWGRDTDEHEARDQLIAFAEAGGTLLDTAAGYGDGAREELIGTLHRRRRRPRRGGPRDQGRHLRRTGARVTDTSRGSLLTTLDASLKRLGVDHVDLWQVHVWTDETPVEETLSALDLAVTSGRASYVGVSNYTGWQTAQAATWQRAVPGRAPLASTQVEYSLLNRDIEHEVRARRAGARARRAPLVAARPRRADREVPHRHPVGLPRGVAALRRLRRASTSTSGAAAIVEAVARAADGLGWSPLEVALVWVRDRPGRHRPDRRCPHRRAAARRARHRGADPARRDRRRPRRRVGRLSTR